MNRFITKIFSLKTLKYVLITISAFLLLAVIGYFSLRNYILKKAIAKVKNKVENTTYLKLTIQDAQFTAYNTIQLTQISLVPHNRDTLLTIDTVTASVKMLPALFGNINLSRLMVYSPVLNLRKDSTQTNFRALLKPTKKPKKDKTKKTDFAETLYRYIKAAAYNTPDEVRISRATIKLKYQSSLRRITLQSFNYADNYFSGLLTTKRIIKNDSDNEFIRINGSFNKSALSGDVEISHPEKVDIGLASLFKSGLAFKKIKLKFEGFKYENKTLQINLSNKGENISVYNPKLSKDTVVIDNYFAVLLAKVDRNFITIDSSSFINLNWIKANLFAQYPIGKTKHYAIKLKPNSFLNPYPKVCSAPSKAYK